MSSTSIRLCKKQTKPRFPSSRPRRAGVRCTFELQELAKRDIGFCPHGLRYSKVADLHDEAGGPVGSPGYMTFLGQHRELRPHHDFYNMF